MVLTGENWSTGRETLCSVGGRWVNVYGAMVEWNWQGETEVLGEKHYIAWVVGECMGMEHWWSDTDRENWNTETWLSATLSTTILIRTDLGSKPGLHGDSPATDRLSHASLD